MPGHAPGGELHKLWPVPAANTSLAERVPAIVGNEPEVGRGLRSRVRDTYALWGFLYGLAFLAFQYFP
jgi:hypothetical protein